MTRILDFTSCTNELCKKECWRKLTADEIKWLETHANRHSQCHFECDELDEVKDD